MSLPSRPRRNPHAEIAAKNPWYVEDQFAVQLGSPWFRAVIQNRWQVFAAAVDSWVRAAGMAAPVRLLDAGCGDGINLSFFSKLAKDRGWSTRLFGADYNPIRIGRAGSFEACLARTSVSALGYVEGAFDVVLCNHVLEHVPEDQAAMHELRRVLRPGGLLIVGVPNEGSALGLLRNRVLQRSILRTTDHVNMYTRNVLRERLQTADLEIIGIEPDGFFVPHTTLHRWLNRSTLVRASLNGIAQVMPSCASGLMAFAVRPR